MDKRTRGSEAKVVRVGEVLMNKRHGLITDACVVHATGTVERAATLGLLAALPPREATVAADEAYNTRAWVHDTRQLGVIPHVAQTSQLPRPTRGSWPDAAPRAARRRGVVRRA